MKYLTKNLLIFSFLVFLLSGCYLKSVHPLVKPENSSTIPGLSGSWTSDVQTWTFIYSEEDYQRYFPSEEEFSIEFEYEDGEESHPYLIVLESYEDETADTVYFIGSFININGLDFMDLKPAAATYSSETIYYESTLYTNHLFPVHTFSKIDLGGDSLDIQTFKDSWIKELIEENRVRIKHEKTEDGILLTASTNELQTFIEKYGGSNQAFESPITLKRK